MADTPTGFVELLYVNSNITDTERLSPELFTTWYDTVHVPKDIFATSGIKQAYRYYTTASDPSTIERPYLALYPVKFTGYLQSAEFAAIPVTSDILPGPTHEIFAVADFDSRCYKLNAAQSPFKAPYLLTIQAEKIPEETFRGSASWTLFDCYFSLQNRRAPEENDIGVPPVQLAMVWAAHEQELDDAAERYSSLGKIAKFKLLKAFEAES